LQSYGHLKFSQNVWIGPDKSAKWKAQSAKRKAKARFNAPRHYGVIHDDDDDD